jgi:hypothetical protein
LYLNNFMDSLTVPLTQIIASYRNCFSQLHPFEVRNQLLFTSIVIASLRQQ